MDARDLDMLGRRMPTEDLIDRQQAIDELEKIPVREFKKSDNGLLDALVSIGDVYMALMQLLPSAQPCKQTCKSMYADVSDLVSRQAAIDAVEAVGFDTRYYWAIKNLPSAQPEQLGVNLAEVGTDCISRQQAIEEIKAVFEWHDTVTMERMIEHFNNLPSAQPERTCVNCGRTVNNGGWYADGGTRCPIEEHYALPKDGYCHLWEKRNVTDDDYPERREE